jgi:hypothetical protein
MIALSALAFSSTASAVVIDFSVFGTGDTGLTTLVTPEATFNSFGGNFFVGAAGIDDEICALQTNAFNCQTDFEAIFNGLATNFSLVLSGFNPGDTVTFSAFGLGGGLLGQITSSANGLVDFSGLGGIARLFVDDSSTGAGFGYGEWTLDLVAVPEPSVLSILGLGMILLGFACRRKIAS